MQIVRNLAGYSFGRSDLVRRAMSKKKASVMEAERQNFIYGNPAEGVKGCVANGISAEIANKIYDEMTDFAKYAFNKSHAAAYAIVAYRTAYLKCYYPVEFMAALMTSVKDNVQKVISYTMHCKDMGISILPPDVNKGFAVFSADEGSIRYGMAAIKGIGVQVVEDIVKEREQGGEYHSLQDFIERLNGRVNKNVVENLIRSGAMDTLDGNRKQKIIVYQQIMDSVSRERRDNMTGQISLFDLGDEDLSAAKDIPFPNVEEYEKAEILADEKNVLGIYLSGHPLEEYIELMKKNCSRTSADFVPEEGEENAGQAKVQDGERALIGGMIESKKILITKKNQQMAFLTIEDLFGTIEVVVFPREYESKKYLLEEDAKVFIRGRVQVEEERAGKLICQDIIPFDQVPCELWVRFPDLDVYKANEAELLHCIAPYDGKDRICIYLEKENKVVSMPEEYRVDARKIITDRLLCTIHGIAEGEEGVLTGKSVAIKEKSIEK